VFELYGLGLEVIIASGFLQKCSNRKELYPYFAIIEEREHPPRL